MRRKATEVSQRATRRLMSIEGVVSVGLAADEDGAPVITVGVRRSSAQMMRVLPEQVEGLPVEVREIGEIESQGQ